MLNLDKAMVQNSVLTFGVIVELGAGLDEREFVVWVPLQRQSRKSHSLCLTLISIPQDNTPGFAPDVTTMLNNFGGDYLKAGPAYCGLEAEFETPDGRKITLYIADGFDSKWVLTPTSVDIVYNHVSIPRLREAMQRTDSMIVVPEVLRSNDDGQE